MKGYSPSTELINLYDTTREKPFEFMHSRSFVNINVATGWTVSLGGQFPYENVIALPVDEGDFPITMEYQPTAIIQPNANESCAPSNFPYIETTGRNQVTLYAYSIPSSTSMLPIIVNLTQNGSPYGSTNASAERSSVEQTMIQLSQNYFLVEANNDVLTKEHKLTFTVTAYKGGEEVAISRPDTMPEYGIVDQDGLPILNPRPIHDPDPNKDLYPKVLVSGSGTSIQVNITLSKGTIIKNGIAIIQFPVKAGTVFYPRATINAITSTAILEQVDSYNLSFDTLTRSSGRDFYVNGKVLGVNDKWIIEVTKRTLNGAVSSVSSGTITFTNVQTGELYSEKSYSQDLANSKVALGRLDLEEYEVFKEPLIRIDLKVGSKVVASEYIDISVSVFSTLIKPSVQFIQRGLQNIRFLSYTLFDNRTLVPKNGTLTIYKNYVDEGNKLISKDNVNEINYSLIPTESKLEGVKSLVVTFAEIIGGEVTQQLAIPVLGGTGGTGEPPTLNLSALPAVLIVDVDKDYELKSTPVSTLKVYRDGNDVTKDFNFAAVSDGGADFNFELNDNNNQLTITKFKAGANQIVGVIITATNKNNNNIKATGSLQAIRQVEGEILSYYTHIRYTSDPVLGTDITESIVGGTKYMGVAVTTTPDAPTDKAEYKWTPVTEDGPAIDSTKVDYAVSHSGTEWPGLESDLWHDFPESLEEGSYLWTRTKTTYTDGEITYAYSVSYIALDGITARTYLVEPDVEVVVRNKTGTYEPSSIVFTSTYRDGASTTKTALTAYWKIESFDGEVWSTINTHTTSLVSTYSVNSIPENSRMIRASTYLDKDLNIVYDFQTVAVVMDGIDGVDAKLIALSTDTQIFKVLKTGEVTPATATITVGLQGIIESVEWKYSVNGGTFSSDTPAGVSRTDNTVTVTGSEMTATTITVKATDGTVSDTLTIARVFDGSDGSDGKDGADAYTVLLSNESHIFAGDESKALAGSTTSSVIAYKGTEEVTATIDKITGQPTGMITEIFPETDTEPAYFTVDVTPDLITPSGVLIVYLIVDGDQTFTRTFSYAVSYKGSRGPAGPVLVIEAPDGLAFRKNQTKSIQLEVKLMDEDENRINEYADEEIRWERSSSDSTGDILFASTKQGSSIDIDPEFLNVPATYTCFVSKIIRGSDLTANDGELQGELQGRTETSDPLEAISVDTYSPVVYTAHVTTSLETLEEIRNIEKIIENIEINSVTTSDFERTQSRIFGSVSELVKTTADLRTREEGMEDVVEKILLKTETLTSELDMTSRRIRGEVKAISSTGDERYSSLQLEADSIKSEVGKMSKDMSYMSSRITQTADSIRQEVSNIQVGGRNLLLNSNHDEPVILKKQQKEQKTYEITKLWPDTEYTVSISGNYQKPVEVWLATLHKDEEGKIVETEINEDNDIYVGDLENNKLTFTTPIITNYTALIVYSEDLTLTTIQLEKGNRVTDWTPAPEEQEQLLSSVKQTAEGTETSLSNLRDQVQSYMRYEWKEIDGKNEGVLILGERPLEDSEPIPEDDNLQFEIWIWNKRISFMQDDNEVAYISNNKLYITDGEFLSSLRLGNFAFTPRGGGLSFGRVK